MILPPHLHFLIYNIVDRRIPVSFLSASTSYYVEVKER